MSTSLHLHDHKSLLTPVSAAETTALIACHGKSHARPTEADRATTARLLMHLREKEFWLACDCRGAEVSPPPLMSPTHRQGQVYIRRHGVTPHAESCPFFVPENEGGSQEKDVWKSEWLRLKPIVDREPSEKKPAEPGAQKSPRAAPALPGIADILYSILEEVQYTTVAHDDVRTSKDRPATSLRRDAYAKLDLLRDRKMAGELTWGDLACTFLPGLAGHCAKLEKMIDRFPPGRRPQGFFLGVVHDIEPNGHLESTLIWRGGKDERVATAAVQGNVRRAAASPNAPGPYWVFAQLGQRPGETRFGALSAFAMPCLSRSVLLPVDSASERETAEILLSQITYWAKESSFNIPCHLEKPLREEIAPDGVHCKPDFVIWLPDSRRILIETMFDDKSAAHLETKYKQHASMRKLPGVITVIDHSRNDDRMAFAKKLTAIVAGANRQIEEKRPE